MPSPCQGLSFSPSGRRPFAAPKKVKKMLDISCRFCYYTPCSRGSGPKASGGIAQLGERLNGIQEVSGSIPLISTIACLWLVFYGVQAFLFPSKKYIGTMLATSTAVQASSLLLKRPFPRSTDRESGLFLLPGNEFHRETYYRESSSSGSALSSSWRFFVARTVRRRMR